MANKSIYIFILLFSIASCSTAQKKELNNVESLKAKELLASISKINASTPDTISSSFTADGNAGNKKFRVEGKVNFDKKGYYKVTILDYVFQSPVIEAYRELDRLYFYYPAEDKLLTDDVKKIDLSMYTGFKSEYKLLYTLLTGGVPLIEKFSVYKCLYEEKKNEYNLIIENDEYFENIFFRDDFPEKILFIHKLSRSKAEIYLNSITEKDRSIFFKKYKIIAPELNTSISISFIKPQLNTVINVDRLKIEKLPKKTEIIKVN